MKKLHYLLAWIIFANAPFVFAQKTAGIGTDKPNPKAVLELNVENPSINPQGLLLPRLTTTERNLLASGNITSLTGMAVYDITDKTFYTWDGTQWKSAGTLFTTLVGVGGMVVSTSGNSFTVDGSNLRSQWISASSNQIYTNSFVGIGTNNPLAALDIRTPSGNTTINVGSSAIADIVSVDFLKAGSAVWGIGAQTNNDFYISRAAQGDLLRIREVDKVIELANIGNGVKVNNNLTTTGIGYFGTIIGSNLAGAAGSIVTVDGAGRLGLGNISQSQWVTTTNGIYYDGGVGNVVTSYNQFIVNSTNNAQMAIENPSTAIGAVSEFALISNANGGGSQYFVMGVNKGGRNFYIFPQGHPGGDAFNMDFSGNVGIGVASGSTISAKLEVNGNARIAQDLTVSGLSGASGSVVTVDGVGRLGFGTLPVSTPSQWTTSGTNIYYNTGKVGIGTANPTTDLQVFSEANSIAGFINVSTPNNSRFLNMYSGNSSTDFSGIGYNAGTGFEIGTLNNPTNTGTYFTRFRISPSGNVGIGTTAPNERLTIQGNSSVSGIGYFSTISGLALNGATAGSIVTVDGLGKLGFGTLTIPQNQWISASSNQIYTNSFVGINTILNPYNDVMVVNGNGKFSGVVEVGDNAPGNTQKHMIMAYDYGLNLGRLFAYQQGVGPKPILLQPDADPNAMLGIGITSTPTARLDVNGTIRFRSLNTNGSVLTVDGNGNLGLGTMPNNTPSWQLGGNSVVGLTNFGTLTNFDLPFYTNGSERMRISTAGNVGIGTTSAPYKLTIVPSFNNDGVLIDNQNNGFDAVFQMKTSSVVDNDAALFLDDSDGQKLKFALGNTSNDANRQTATRMVLDQNGNVGIGSTSPNEKLTVQGNSSVTGIGYFSTISGLNLNGAASGSILTVDGVGKLGFGTLTIPQSQWLTTSAGIYYSTSVGIGMLPITNTGLSVKSAGNATKPLRILNSATSNPMFEIDEGSGGMTNVMIYNNAGVLVNQIGGTLPSFFNGGGSVGIGTNAPTQGKLVVVEDAGTRPGIFVSGGGATSSASISIGRNTTSDGGIGVAGSALTTLGIATIGDFVVRAETRDLILSSKNNTGNIRFGTGNLPETEKMTILNNGNVGIGVVAPSEKLTIMGNQSTTGIGYFSTISGLALNGATAGSIVTVDGVGRLGFGTMAASTNYWEPNGSSKIYTNSFVGIGNTNPIYPLHIVVGNTNDNAIFVNKNVSGTTGNQVAYSANFSGVPTSGMKIGYESNITPTANEAVRGMSSTIINNLSINDLFASFSYINNNANGKSVAFRAVNDGSGVGDHIGFSAFDNSTGNGQRYGVHSEMIGTGATATNYALYGKATGAGANNYAGYFDDGNVYMKDNVVIGNLTPTAKLDITGTIRFRNFTNGILTVDGTGLVGVGTMPTPNSWKSTTSGITFTDDKIAIGTSTVAGAARFKVAGDGSMGGMVITSQSLVNPISTSNTIYTTLITVPVYIPAGTNTVEFNVIGSSQGGGNINFQLEINGFTSAAISMNNTTPTIGSTPQIVNVASFNGWQTLKINVANSAGNTSAILNGYTVIVKD
ncbi:MAG: hypothetical protein EAZ27_00230 [Cytophagales bacterium]|nr:MAG: hypothetical protein EAZ27_00230 [Cytophagales bacterium]